MEKNKSFYAFILACIPARLFLAFLAWYFASIKNFNLLVAMGCGFLIIAIMMWYFYLSGTRKTGPEAPDGIIWWDWARPIHASMYILFAYYAISKKNCAKNILLIDTLLGLSFFAAKRLND
jgi:hypothetical protein